MTKKELRITARDTRAISISIALAKIDDTKCWKIVEGESINEIEYFHPDRDMGEVEFIVVGDKVLPYYKHFKRGRLLDENFNYHNGEFILLSNRKAINEDGEVIYYKSFEGKWDFLDKDM